MPLRIIPATGPIYRRKEFRIWPLDGFGGSGAGPLIFSDFTSPPARGDQPFLVGDNWLCLPVPGVAGQGNMLSFATAYNVGSGVLSMGIASTNGQNQCMNVPGPGVLDLYTLFNIPQYAEYALRSNNSIPGALDRRGPMVLAQQNKQSCYALLITFETLTVAINKYLGSSNSIIGTAFAIALNDTVRIEADNTSNPAATIIRAYKNGALMDTVVDVALGGNPRLTNGWPGILDQFCSSGITTSLSDFVCGAL